MKRILDDVDPAAITIALVVLAITLVLAIMIIEKFPTSDFELCRSAFGQQWYPVYTDDNLPGTCRHLNGTIRSVDWSKIQ